MILDAILLALAEITSTQSTSAPSLHCLPAFQRYESVSVYLMGRRGFFFILKLENETLMYYELAIGRLSRDVVEDSDLPLREIVQLICE